MNRTGLEHVVRGSLATSLVFAMSLFMPPPIRPKAAGVLEVYRRFLDMVGRDNLRFYATETMSKHRKVTKKTFDMLPTWLAADAPARQYIDLQLKDGEEHADAPHLLFHVMSEENPVDPEPAEHAAMIRMAVPPEWVDEAERLAALEAFFVACCDRLAPRYATAGYAFHCSPYEARDGQTFAWQKGMRHIGADIHFRGRDRWTVGWDGIKGVNWLTMIDADFIAEIGGIDALRDALPAEVTIRDVAGGVLFRCGDRPSIGDRNRQDDLPLYRAVHRALAPLMTAAHDRAPLLSLKSDDPADQSRRWLKRFETP